MSGKCPRALRRNNRETDDIKQVPTPQSASRISKLFLLARDGVDHFLALRTRALFLMATGVRIFEAR
jgi:hypothetical protein